MNESFTDSDDEEILFTKEMVRRLKKSAQQKIPVNSRPTSSLSDASGVSAVSTASGQKKIEDTVESTTQRSSECSPVKETLSSGNVLLSPRTRTRVLREIWESCDATAKEGGLRVGTGAKKYFFRQKLSEFNNTIRVLESKQEEALWNEEYKLAAEIENCLKKFRAKKAPLQEVLLERIQALERHDFSEAQRAKDIFERTMDSALQDREFEKFLSEQEIQRLKKHSPTN